MIKFFVCCTIAQLQQGASFRLGRDATARRGADVAVIGWHRHEMVTWGTTGLLSLERLRTA